MSSFAREIYDATHIGYDTTFELNQFNQPRIRSEIETTRDILLFILFSKPGQYPSLPMIGLDIERLLHSYYDSIDVHKLQNDIIAQCDMLNIPFSAGNIAIVKTIYNKQPSLLIKVVGSEVFPKGYMKDTYTNPNNYIIGITFDDSDNLIYNINSER